MSVHLGGVVGRMARFCEGVPRRTCGSTPSMADWAARNHESPGLAPSELNTRSSIEISDGL